MTTSAAFSENIGTSPISARDKVLEEVKRLRIHGQKYLDIGCGDGEFSTRLAKTVNACLVYGADVSIRALEIASTKGLKTLYIDLNKEQLPFHADFFDLITAIEVIEHLTDTDNLLQEAHRCLRKGGYFITTTPNLASWINRILLLLGYIPAMYDVSFKYRLGKPSRNKTQFSSGHIRLYTLKALVDHLEIYGFRIISRKGVTMTNKKGFMRFLDKAIELIRAYGLSSDLIVVAQK